MPSSTFSFDRPVPAVPWLRITTVAILLTGIFMTGWELYWITQGYRPGLDDTKDLWAENRRRVQPDSTVFIGSSRTLYGIDLDQFKEILGEPPVQLSIVGSSARPVLRELAQDPSFRGTVFCGVVPGLFFAPAGMPMERPSEWLAYSRKWSPSRQSGHRLGMFLQNHLAFLQQEDLTLNELLLELRLPERPEAQLMPEMPPFLSTLRRDRRAFLLEKGETDEAFQKRVQDIWMGLFGMVPRLPPEMVETIVQDVKEDVDAIESRGGRVIFLRLPSSGGLRELERKTTPREHFWDRLLEVTGRPGIHFEDFPALASFDCPEWSHLSHSDSVRFTKELIAILRAKKLI